MYWVVSLLCLARALKLVSYNSLLESNVDLFTHFCQNFLHWHNPPATGLGRVNESLGMVDTEIIRALNGLEWMRARDERARLYKPYMAAKAALPIHFIVEQSMQYVVDSIRFDDATRTLARIHDGLVERYGAALVPPFPAAALFRPQCVNVDHVRQDYLFADGIMETLREMRTTLLPRVQTE